MNPVPPYAGENQSQQINVPAQIAYQGPQYSPEEGCWVMPPYANIFGIPAQPDSVGNAFLPPPVQTTDIFSAQQTFPL
jgi:hypothetical protein